MNKTQTVLFIPQFFILIFLSRSDDYCFRAGQF